MLVFDAVSGLAIAIPLAATTTVPLRHVFGINDSETDDETAKSA